VSVLVIYNSARHNVLDTKKWDTGTVGCERRTEEEGEGEGEGMNLDTPPPLGQVAVAYPMLGSTVCRAAPPSFLLLDPRFLHKSSLFPGLSLGLAFFEHPRQTWCIGGSGPKHVRQ
jgi:hypothetical protein